MIPPTIHKFREILIDWVFLSLIYTYANRAKGNTEDNEKMKETYLNILYDQGDMSNEKLPYVARKTLMVGGIERSKNAALRNRSLQFRNFR
jgi:hypothetical protein